MALSKEYILTLLKTPKIGQVSAKAINSHSTFKISSVNELYDLIVDIKTTNSKIPLPELKDLLHANLLAQKMLDDCENKGISVITANESLYPIKLMRLSDYPIITYVKGSISAINSQLTAAVIGTREPSTFGIKAGRRVSSIMGKNGFTIISGLAIGCDTSGHQGALDAGTPTVAVLASGVDIIYPKENKYLADKIIEAGGALFSEYELNFKPQKSSFVERDRLQAGLSNGLIVVETDIKGGTMHTVGFAEKMNIPIGCITGHPESLKDFPKINGNNYLISGGASSIGNSEQIFAFIKRLNPNVVEFIGDDKVKEKPVFNDSDETSQKTVDANKDEFLTLNENKITPSIEHAELLLKLVNEDNKNGIESDPLQQSVGELKELMQILIAEQQSTNSLLNKLFAQLNSKEKSTKKKQPNQPELL